MVAEQMVLRSVWASAASVLLNLPALGFTGWTVTAGARQISHTFSFAFILAILTNLVQYVAWKTPSRRGKFFIKYGPVLLLTAAVPFVMADLTRHVLLDSQLISGPSMYREHCPYSVHGFLAFRCLSVAGWFFTIIFTYTGHACMIAGVVWGSNVHVKIRQAWSKARKGGRP